MDRMNVFNHQYWTQWIRTRPQTLQGEWKHPRGMVWGPSVMSRVMIFPGWVWLIYGISTSFIIWVQYGSMFQWAQGSMSLRKSGIDYNWSALFNPASWSWCRKVLAWQHAPDVFAVHILQQSQLKTHWFAGAFHQEDTSIASQAERIGTLDDFGLKAAWQMTVTLRMIPKVANT